MGTSCDFPPVSDLVPHAGSMCLLERIVSFNDDEVVVETGSHRSHRNPLARDGRLASVHLCEYGAQAMAVHGGLLARRAGGKAHPGLLVSLRDVWISGIDVASIEGVLRVVAARVHGDAAGWQYEFRVSAGDTPIATGRATVALRASAP